MPLLKTLKSLNPRLCLFLGSLIIAGMLIPSRFAVSLTPSTETRVFFLKNGPSSAELNKGAYVMFELRFKYIDKGVSHGVIKQIMCVEGDHLSRLANTFFCNGKKVAVTKSTSRAGAELPQFYFDGNIPAGFIFVAGRHKDSYDSRYFGLLKKEEVQTVAYPLF